jgi:hypothetical protein
MSTTMGSARLQSDQVQSFERGSPILAEEIVTISQNQVSEEISAIKKTFSLKRRRDDWRSQVMSCHKAIRISCTSWSSILVLLLVVHVHQSSAFHSGGTIAGFSIPQVGGRTRIRQQPCGRNFRSVRSYQSVPPVVFQTHKESLQLDNEVRTFDMGS